MSTDIKYENGKLYVTRVYAAPRAAVFDAWIETSKVDQWWGCAQTTAVRSEIEPRVGGKYNHLMTIEGAGDFPAQATISEFDPPNRLAYESPASEMAPAMKVTVDFLEHPDGTEVRLVHEGLPEDFVDMVSKGWPAAFEKLEKLLTANIS